MTRDQQTKNTQKRCGKKKEHLHNETKIIEQTHTANFDTLESIWLDI